MALPITVVCMIIKSRTRTMDRKMDILMKAVENGQQVDPALLTTAQEGEGKYRLKRNLLNRLLFGTMISLFGLVFFVLNIVFKGQGSDYVISLIPLSIGIGFLVSFFVGRKMLAKEIAAEEAKCQESDQ